MFAPILAAMVGTVLMYAAIKNVSVQQALHDLLISGTGEPSAAQWPWETSPAAVGNLVNQGLGQAASPNSPGAPQVIKSGLLIHLGHVAEGMGLRVSECDAPGAPARWGPVHQVHTAGSLHYQHRAFDASGTAIQMAAFTAYCRHYTSQLAELIHNPGGAVKNGHAVSGPGVFGAVWGQHTNHVHVGV